MFKKKLSTVRDFVVKNCKIVFPILLIAVAAITALVALKAVRARENAELPEESIQEESVEESTVPAEEVPMIENDDKEVMSLVELYYTAKGDGDVETMKAVHDYISEPDLYYYEELAKYIDSYSDLYVLTKNGPLEGSVVAYVYLKMGIINYDSVPGYETLYLCRNEEGKLYIKNQNNCTDEERDYIKTLCEQVDVVEFNNRVNAEYNNMMAENPELLEYLGLLGEQVQIAVGERFGEQNSVSEEEGTETEEIQETETPAEEDDTEVAEEGPRYARANTTVNVRSSDSEQAEKLGKLTNGSRVQIQEVRVNGWTKILYEKKDGYVKTEYLTFEEDVASIEVIGTVKANTNINVRAAASETAERLGALPGGGTADLFAVEGDWCKINYNGQVAYVKAEYVTRQ